MADNVNIDPGTTPSVPVAADEIAGVKYQRVKLAIGDDGTAVDVGASQAVPVSISGTVPVSNATLPLPTGASTDATLTGQSTLYGAVGETAPASDTASSGLNGRMQRVAQRLTTLIGLLPGSLGQKTMANGLAVTIASDQSAVPISGSISVTGTMPISAASGSQVDGHSATLGLTTDAAATTTGSVIAQLRRIANAVAGTVAVSGTFWQATQPVSQTTPVQAATGTLSNVSGSASSVTLIASNSARKGLTIINDSTAILYVKCGATGAASATSFTYFLAPITGSVPATLELPANVYTGVVTGIWGSATGSARVTEFT